MFHSKYQVPLYLWHIELIIRSWKASKYYVNNCRYLSFFVTNQLLIIYLHISIISLLWICFNEFAFENASFCILLAILEKWKWFSLREKCPYSELFWSVFSSIRTGYGDTRSFSPYSVWMRENTEQNTSEYVHFLRSVKVNKRDPTIKETLYARLTSMHVMSPQIVKCLGFFW